MKRLFLLVLFALITTNVYASDNWYAGIKVKANRIDSRVVFGQNASATEGFDPTFDVQFFGDGDLLAYFVSDGGNLFKDIRNIQSDDTWTLRIEVRDKDVKKVGLFWQKEKLPGNIEFYLTDPVTGNTLNMKQLNYFGFPNTGIKYLDIKVVR